jgi:hypothetical protein
MLFRSPRAPQSQRSHVERVIAVVTLAMDFPANELNLASGQPHLPALMARRSTSEATATA